MTTNNVNISIEFILLLIYFLFSIISGRILQSDNKKVKKCRDWVKKHIGDKLVIKWKEKENE